MVTKLFTMPLTQRLRLGGLIAALGLLIGHMTPWVAHRAAALTLSGHDLATFTRYTPGAGIFLAQWYYLSLWAGALLLAMSGAVIKSVWNRLAVGLLAVLVAALGLPGYPQVLSAFREPDYQFQFFASLLVMVGAMAISWRPLERVARIQAVVLIVLSVASIVPVAGYLAVKPALEQLYNESLGLGWGWWTTLFGVLVGLKVAVMALANLLRRNTP